MSIMEMSAQEILLFEKLVEFAKEAKEAAELILKHFFSGGFGTGKTEIHVYQSDYFGEYYGDGYLTNYGTFRYFDNLGVDRSYEFFCDEDGIYKMLRSCYLRRNKLEQFDTEKFECQIENLDIYFRDFIQRLKKKES